MKFLILCLLIVAVPKALSQVDCTDCPPREIPTPEVPLPQWPLQLIDIATANYPRNSHASFCKRPVDMVDTIVFHHSETPSTTTPMQINQMHLNRGTPNDPWYMVAYSYQVQAPYPGNSNPAPRVTEGRPLDIVGAHAGSNAFVSINAEQRKMWDDGLITCGRENENFYVDPKLMNSRGQLKANITTVGVVVIGNYAPFSRSNPNGYSRSRPRYPSRSTLDMLARLSCQLQKKYPNMKNMKWHSFYHATTCPGNIKDHVPQIRAMAKVYGCDFN